jgi:hypothetical protein
MRTGIASLAAMAALVASTGIAPAKSNAIIISSFTAGDIDPAGKVPTVDGVSGAGVSNWDIPLPLSLLKSGTSYMYSLTFEVMDEGGTCDATYKLTQRGTTLDSGVIIAGFSCTTDIYLLHAAGRAIPASPGPATLAVTVKEGGHKATLKVPVVIQ